MAELVPSTTLAKIVSSKQAQYSVRNIFEEEKDEEAQYAQQEQDLELSQKSGTEDNVDIEDLLENIETEENLKQGSMHHFVMNRRETVQVYTFESAHNVH